MRTSPDPPDEPVPSPRAAAIRRKAIAARRAGEKVCACGENRPEALIKYRDPAICMECDREQRGVSTVDIHHVAGKANSPVTMPVLANDHQAVLNVAQYEWPQKTLENPDGSPLLALAARARGYMDTDDYLKKKLLSPNPELLELLDAFLTEKFGPQWWRNTELERFIARH